MDYERGIKIALVNITLKEGNQIEDLDLMSGIVLSVIKANEEKNEYICLIKSQPPLKLFNKFKFLAKKFDLNLKWDVPTVFTEEKMVFSVIGEEESLKKFIRNIKIMGKIIQISFQEPVFTGHSVMECLTDKQKEIILAAKNNGYYEYPRKVDTEDLAKKIGISKSTTVEHLRKAENRIISHILTGY